MLDDVWLLTKFGEMNRGENEEWDRQTELGMRRERQ